MKNFGSVYGMGVPGFVEKFGRFIRPGAEAAGLSVLEYAKKIDEEYYRMVPFVRPTSQGMQALCQAKGFMRSVGGRIHHRPRRGCADGRPKDYAIVNYVCQGGASDILKIGFVNAWDAGVFNEIKLHITVHDENVFSVYPTKASIEAAREFSHIMQNAVKLKVPIRVDEEAGPNWASCDNDKWRTWCAKVGV
jgi:DNA polymerase-1